MIALEEMEIQEVSQGTYELVKGEFSAAEAAEIVNDLFNKKINFHEVQSFSQLIRFGSKDEETLERVKELKISLKDARELIAEARESGKSLRIHSNISIELT